MDLHEIKQLLIEIEESFPNHKTAIAGGFVRDYLLGKPIKDIDVLILGVGDLTSELLEHLTFRFNEPKLYALSDYDGGDTISGLQDIFKSHDKVLGMDVDFLPVEGSLEEIIGFCGFDISLCECAIYLDGIDHIPKVIVSKSWINCIKDPNKVMTYNRYDSGHYLRLAQKYPEYTWYPSREVSILGLDWDYSGMILEDFKKKLLTF